MPQENADLLAVERGDRQIEMTVPVEVTCRDHEGTPGRGGIPPGIEAAVTPSQEDGDGVGTRVGHHEIRDAVVVDGGEGSAAVDKDGDVALRRRPRGRIRPGIRHGQINATVPGEISADQCVGIGSLVEA